MKHVVALAVMLLAVTTASAAPSGTYSFDTKLKAPSITLQGKTTDTLLAITTGYNNLVAITGAGAITAVSWSGTWTGPVAPSALSAGSLDSDVIASSIAVAAVRDNSIVSVSPTKVSAGSLATNVVAKAFLAPAYTLDEMNLADLPIGTVINVTNATKSALCVSSGTPGGFVEAGDNTSHCQ